MVREVRRTVEYRLMGFGGGALFCFYFDNTSPLPPWVCTYTDGRHATFADMKKSMIACLPQISLDDRDVQILRNMGNPLEGIFK